MEVKKKVFIFTSKKNVKILKKKLSKYRDYNLKIIDKKNKILSGDILISFVNGVILSEKILKKFKLSINFHPAPPSLPGRDPHHWAIFFKKKNYGITIHRMEKKVDTGKILFTKYFKINKKDNPQNLRKKSFDLSLQILIKNFDKIVDNRFKEKKIQWARSKKKRSDVFSLINNLKKFKKIKQNNIKKSFRDFF
tara:strand:+ start:1242 stop:1823 length:582 start_codon:yes stop_codon:yes gene_type:complete